LKVLGLEVVNIKREGNFLKIFESVINSTKILMKAGFYRFSKELKKIPLLKKYNCQEEDVEKSPIDSFEVSAIFLER